MPDTKYQRLTRSRVSQRFALVSAPRVSLWLGEDHLLLVEHRGFSEAYKRFYFRDIQAIIVRQTTRQAIWNAVLAVPVALCLVAVIVSAAMARSAPGTVTWAISVFAPATITWAIFLLLFLLPFIVNNLRGTACSCQLRTAVQTEDIASLSRLRQTHKVLDKIRPLIVAAQGQLAPEEVSVRMREAAAGLTTAQSLEPPRSSESAPPVLS